MDWLGMSGPDPGAIPDEFGQIAELFRPLTGGEPGALDLLDDAAVLPVRAGSDIVVTQDAIVEGVHFPTGESPEDVAARFFRVNLSDLAAKGAEPFAWLQSIAWSKAWALEKRRSFARALADEAREFGLVLLGGDTVSTPGPFMASGTFFGRCPPGGIIRRSGARPGDALFVSGPIGDGWLGLKAVMGEIEDPSGALRQGFRRPKPRLDLRETLRDCATAAADVSDGLIADSGHIAEASGCGVCLDLERMPLSGPAQEWLGSQTDRFMALTGLASGGDDYQIAFAAPLSKRERLEGAGCTRIGDFVDGPSEIRLSGVAYAPGPGGWRHE